MGTLNEYNGIALFTRHRGFHHAIHQLFEFRDIAHIVMAGNKSCLAAAEVQMKAQPVKVAYGDGGAVIGRGFQHAQGDGVHIHNEFSACGLCQFADFLALGFNDSQEGRVFNIHSSRILVQFGL